MKHYFVICLLLMDCFTAFAMTGRGVAMTVHKWVSYAGSAQYVRTLPVTILPSFWETPPAYILYALAILLIIFTAAYILFTIFRLRHKVENLLIRHRKLRELYYAGLMEPDLIAENEGTGSPEVEEQPVSPKDRKFMEKLVELMEKNMDNSELVVDDLAKELAMSRSVFFKKLKTLTGLAPIEFIREIRIKRAAELIRTNEYTITQVSEIVGINDSRYFSKCFKRVYGMTPTAYKEQYLHKNEQNIHL